jgi:hypothetical protein
MPLSYPTSKLPKVRARRTREIRVERMFGNVPISSYQRIGVDVVRANRMFHCGSLVCASRSSASVALAVPP